MLDTRVDIHLEMPLILLPTTTTDINSAPATPPYAAPGCKIKSDEF